MSHPRAIVVVQARMTSSRLPGKVLALLGRDPVLAWVVDRAGRIPGVSEVWVATPEGSEHDPIAHWVDGAAGVRLHRGPEVDVLARMLGAARAARAEVVVRVTADCPFLDPALGGAVLSILHETGADYAATAMDSGWPIGLDVEATWTRHLETAAAEARDSYEREHATAFLWRRPERFTAAFLDRQPDLRHWRLTVDTPEDLAVARRIAACLEDPRAPFSVLEALLRAKPELLEGNQEVAQKAYRWLAH